MAAKLYREVTRAETHPVTLPRVRPVMVTGEPAGPLAGPKEPMVEVWNRAAQGSSRASTSKKQPARARRVTRATRAAKT